MLTAVPLKVLPHLRIRPMIEAECSECQVTVIVTFTWSCDCAVVREQRGGVVFLVEVHKETTISLRTSAVHKEFTCIFGLNDFGGAGLVILVEGEGAEAGPVQLSITEPGAYATWEDAHPSIVRGPCNRYETLGTDAIDNKLRASGLECNAFIEKVSTVHPKANGGASKAKGTVGRS